MKGIDIVDIDDYLRKTGIKPSYQRKAIFEYLMKSNYHSTVNDIYMALSGDISTLSKTTIYNTLNLFVDHNIVEVINIDPTEARYDVVREVPHGHFKCEECGKIYDIFLDFNTLPVKALNNFTIRTQQINLTGVCEKCNGK